MEVARWLMIQGPSLCMYWLHAVARADSPGVDPEDPLRAHASWDAASLNTTHAAVAIDAPSDRGVRVRAQSRVRFGNADYAWTTESKEVPARRSDTIEVEVPAEAFLHPLATQYVSDLTTRVWMTDAMGRSEVVLLRGFVLWDDAGAVAKVIGPDQLEAVAPLGIVDPRVREALPAGLELGERVMPPVWDTQAATVGREVRE